METSNEKSTATLIHLSTMTQYFIPFGNYIFPILIWATGKKDSSYIDHHGKQAINFQLSMLLYSLLLCMIAIPIFIFTIFKNIPMNAVIEGDDFLIDNLNFENITGILTIGITAVFIFGVLKIAEFFLIIYASVKAANGEKYKYPLTINFIKSQNSIEEKIFEKHEEAQA